MTRTLAAEERDDALLLTADHTQLEFFIARPGFRLLRDEAELLRTGAGWGYPVTTLLQWQADSEQVVLTYNRGTHGYGRLVITAEQDGWHLRWDQPTQDTYDLQSAGHWYGEGELVHQHWPLERMSLREAPFITWDNGPTGLGNVVTPAWITSSGVALLLDKPSDTLQVGFNAPPAGTPEPGDDPLSGQATAAMRPQPAQPGATGLLTLMDRNAPLSYRLLVGQHAPEAFGHTIRHLGKPSATPPPDLLRQPIWTTWARYKTAIDQETVLRFAQEIREHGYPGGTLEIDDKWQVHYGDFEFDPVRFPYPAVMVAQLNALGFAVTVWTTPFISPYADNLAEAQRYNFLVRRPDGMPYPVRWWQGEGYLLDLSNAVAVEWWAGQLLQLQHSVGLAGYKFDAGEANFLPADALTHTPMSRNDYSTRWAEFAAEHFPYSEVRCGWYSQRQAVLVRQWDKFSTWGLDNGLASVITSALALSMTGYPFTLPDMIGGNAYSGIEADKELLIRWTQASAPMLAIQFSLAPWDYDAETVDICRRYAQLHTDLASERLAAADGAVTTGEPVVRPVFWLAPYDPDALPINDQYLLGSNLLVAPVVKPGARQRDVYLPPGRWRDYWTGAEYSGGWLRDFPAPLDTLPLFARLDW